MKNINKILSSFAIVFALQTTTSYGAALPEEKPLIVKNAIKQVEVNQLEMLQIVGNQGKKARMEVEDYINYYEGDVIRVGQQVECYLSTLTEEFSVAPIVVQKLSQSKEYLDTLNNYFVALNRYQFASGIANRIFKAMKMITVNEDLRALRLKNNSFVSGLKRISDSFEDKISEMHMTPENIAHYEDWVMSNYS